MELVRPSSMEMHSHPSVRNVLDSKTSVVILGKVANQVRTETIGDCQRQSAPSFYRERVPATVSRQLGHLAPFAKPIIPVQLFRLCSPLFLESVRSTADRGTTEIKVMRSTSYGISEYFPVQQHVDADRIILSHRSCPGDLAVLVFI